MNILPLHTIQDPRTLLALASGFAKAKKYEDAKNALEHANLIKPTAENYYNIGVIHELLGAHTSATDAFIKAIEMDESMLLAWEALGKAYTNRQMYEHAALIFSKIAKENPRENRFRHYLSLNLKEMTMVTFEPAFREALLLCLETEGIQTEYLTRAFFVTFTLDPRMAPIVSDIRINDYATYEASMSVDKLKIYQDPLFILGLTRILMCANDHEQLIVFLRRYLLTKFATAPESMVMFGDIARAINAQCFLNEYIYDVTADELTLVNTLISRLQTQHDWTSETSMALSLIGCYIPLIGLRGKTPLLSDKLLKAALKRDKFLNLNNILEKQILDIEEERQIAQTIPRLMPDKDKTMSGVSAAVKAMYEENPYPRWQFASTESNKPPSYIDVESLRKPKTPLKILNAGCGTGKHAVITYNTFPDDDITAIDLSFASLAYAIRQTRKMGIKNIKFYQANILDLKHYSEKFDVIESAGVLHHLEDPFEGWQNLANLLNPGGYMMIGLYSEYARTAVVQCRTLIEKEHFPATREGIRACRAHIRALPNGDPTKKIAQISDFFATSPCRDLIFHVQEHRFTIPKIKDYLDRLGLEFVAFQAPTANIKADYLNDYPDDPTLKNLENWDNYEKRNPDTFVTMYQFWCRKK